MNHTDLESLMDVCTRTEDISHSSPDKAHKIWDGISE